MTTLIIDDNEITRELLRVTMRSDGYQVLGEATDGESGMEMVARLKPDVVFLDIVMPGMSGIDVLKSIKSKLPKTVVLMVTGNSDRATVQAAVQNGAGGFILKPFNTGTVLKTVENALQRARSA
ncbi:MAG: response regulator [Burkholderiales bacterium]|nr:response regulator [Burkholderiales bacterium]